MKDFDTADDVWNELKSLGVAFANDRDRVWTAIDPKGKGSMRPSDWDCPECGALVFGSKVRSHTPQTK